MESRLRVLLLIVISVGLGGCAHLPHLWPFHRHAKTAQAGPGPDERDGHGANRQARDCPTAGESPSESGIPMLRSRPQRVCSTLSNTVRTRPLISVARTTSRNGSLPKEASASPNGAPTSYVDATGNRAAF
jgi:hypothetical protein